MLDRQQTLAEIRRTLSLTDRHFVAACGRGEEGYVANAPRMIPKVSSNLLLSQIVGRAASELQKRASVVELRFEDVLHHPGAEQSYVYFPTAGIVSILYTMENGSSAEIGLVGRDGMVGMAGALGGKSTTTRSMVQSPGFAVRVSTSDVQALIASERSFRSMVFRYAQVLLTQTTQTAVCNRYHTTVQQLSRWILQSTDLNDSAEIAMTQQLMAEMLGVRREGVSVVAAQLRDEGVIEYTRGRLKLLDREKLERSACECYRVVRAETKRLMRP